MLDCVVLDQHLCSSVSEGRDIKHKKIIIIYCLSNMLRYLKILYHILNY